MEIISFIAGLTLGGWIVWRLSRAQQDVLAARLRQDLLDEQLQQVREKRDRWASDYRHLAGEVLKVLREQDFPSNDSE